MLTPPPPAPLFLRLCICSHIKRLKNKTMHFDIFLYSSVQNCPVDLLHSYIVQTEHFWTSTRRGLSCYGRI